MVRISLGTNNTSRINDSRSIPMRNTKLPLPGESPADFEKLHKDLISELAPVEALENDIVATIARLLWRKQNLNPAGDQ